MPDTPPFEKTTAAAEALPSTREMEPPLLGDRYRLIERIGEGGMGQVFRAEHVLMKKKVAIKVLHAELTQKEEMVARFQREAQAAASLKSPYVCQATDFGQTDEGAFYLVMEHLEGKTLEAALHQEKRIEEARALGLIRQVASALEEAHRAGIFHRDLKPENIMLLKGAGEDSAETVKIMDFGIARVTAAEDDSDDDSPARLTRQGMIFGTPHYMSPEQVSGDDVDHRSDLYSLGVVLFEMLSGRPPFDGESIARIMGHHVTSPPPDLNELLPEIRFSPAVLEILDLLLKKDRQERPDDASALIALIDQALEKSNAPQRGFDLALPKLNSVTDAAALTGTTAVNSVETALDKLLLGMETSWRFWERLDQTRRLSLIAGSVAFAVVVTALTLVFLLGSDGHQARMISEHRESLLEDPQIALAITEAQSGNRTALSELLEEKNDDAGLRFLALQADLGAGRSVDIVDEAREIIELDSRYENEVDLMALVVNRLPSGRHGEAAAEFLSEHLSDAAREALSEMARTDSRAANRNRAYSFLKEEGQLRRFPRWEQTALELRQASGCEAHRELIEKLVSIGEPAALSTLEALQSTPRRGCGALRQQDCYGCIRGDLSKAIEALSGEGS